MWSCWAPMVQSCLYNELPLLWSAHLVSMSSKYCDRDELTICIFVNIVIALSWCCCDNQEITPIPLFFIQICTNTPTQSRTVCIAYTPTSLSPNISHLNIPHFHFHFNGIFKGTNMLSVSLWTFFGIFQACSELIGDQPRGALLILTVTSSALKDTLYPSATE